MTSVTSVNPVESCVESARREIDWRTRRIRYHDVSKGELASAGGLAALTSHRELAVQLGVHLFVPLVAPHLVHGLPHHSHGHYEALSGNVREQSQSITLAALHFTRIAFAFLCLHWFAVKNRCYVVFLYNG